MNYSCTKAIETVKYTIQGNHDCIASTKTCKNHPKKFKKQKEYVKVLLFLSGFHLAFSFGDLYSKLYRK